ncbi:hypothetical protein AVEN_110949-1 [Araneus ventricosus]|uniref:Uncharacterized protein n=1 Tax=Araneus ventricosus TaxID=182803 RepID=A0A4Y2HD98_ARAVE|nr:hypothetical protein AVEN_110949-1 [Araneus ventricosus]
MAPRGCAISPDNFCFICGECTVKCQQKNISDFLKKVYFDYFKLKIGVEDKPRSPHKMCRRCEEDLRLWFKVPHTSEIQVPHPPSSLDDIWSDSEDGDTLPHKDESSSDFSFYEDVQPFSQSDLNDLVRDLRLSKDGSELLGSRLKNKNLLTAGTSFSWYRHREKEFTQFFSKDGNLVFCNDVQGLMKSFDMKYDPYEWRLFIDSSKISLKAVLLHNGNSFASLPLGHSLHLGENYNDLSIILEKINYQHRSMVCGDFKILTMLLGQQAGYTKYP